MGSFPPFLPNRCRKSSGACLGRPLLGRASGGSLLPGPVARSADRMALLASLSGTGQLYAGGSTATLPTFPASCCSPFWLIS